jgi:hypothetical protein
MKGPIYYLPGHGGVLHKELGAALLFLSYEMGAGCEAGKDFPDPAVRCYSLELLHAISNE